MTDHERNVDRHVTITIATGATWAEAIGALKLESGKTPVLILPSSLRRTDRLASAVRYQLRRAGIASHLVLPAHPASALIGQVRRSTQGRWLEVELRAPGVSPSWITIPARLNGPESIWTITDVDAVGGTGPYILDLLARFAHPRTRLRQLASRRRSDAVVDVNLVATPSRCVMGKLVGGTVVVAIVNDPIAAELFALALADEDLPPDRVVTGPWEDRVVQRATELELGVQIPQHIAVNLVTTPEPGVRTALERTLTRIGVPGA